ncbi:MAG: hypothetical protein ACTSUT_09880 [Promethearchaeota archaeon]
MDERNCSITSAVDEEEKRAGEAFVVDEIEGFFKMLNSDAAIGEVINIGNDKQYTILQLAEIIKELINSNSKIVFKPLPVDDPVRRCPVLKKAKEILNWEPTTSLDVGLKKTIAWFKDNERKG